MKIFSAKIIDIPLVSSNSRLIPNKTGSRLVPNTKYKRSKEALFFRFNQLREFETYKNECVIMIVIETYKDADNVGKIIIDALQDAGIIENDKNVAFVGIWKIPIKKNHQEKFIVNVYPLLGINWNEVIKENTEFLNI